MSVDVLIDTSLGQIELELYWDHAPKVCGYQAETGRFAGES
jgi:peptidyl-prolyl cis-trans isomerase-like 1